MLRSHEAIFFLLSLLLVMAHISQLTSIRTLVSTIMDPEKRHKKRGRTCNGDLCCSCWATLQVEWQYVCAEREMNLTGHNNSEMINGPASASAARDARRI